MSHGAKMFRAAAVATVCVVGLAMWSGSQEQRPKTAGKDPLDSPAGAGSEDHPSAGGGTSAAKTEETGDEAVFKKLGEPTEFSFKGTPLKDALAAIAKKHKLTIVIDDKKLDEANVSAKTPLTHAARGVPLEIALQKLLNEVGLDYIVRDEVVEVTSRDMADTYLIYRIYPVADLIVPPPQASAADAEARPDYESLIQMIQQTVYPDSWAEAGGPGIAGRLPGCLMVHQTIDHHRQVQVLLQVLRKARKIAAGSGPPMEHAIRVRESEFDQRIEESLGRRVSVSLADASLSDIVKLLSKEHGIVAKINVKKVEEWGFDPRKVRGTFAADNISLRSALRWLLRGYALSWIVRDGELLITSREEAENYLVTRLYPVADLVPDGGRKASLERAERAGPGAFGRAAIAPEADDWLLQTIKGTVLPDHWRDAGGPAEVEWAPHVPLLVCTIDQQGHQEMERVLADLRKHVKPHAKPVGETLPQPKTLWAYAIVSDSADSAKLADEAAKLIRDTIAPETWNAKDADALIRAWPDRIVVRHTAKVHREVQKLLQEVGLLKPSDAAERPTPPPSDD
jgi:hypothetical protein